ncbi:fasciclin domain-containing protein [Nocardia sp. NPDC003963]
MKIHSDTAALSAAPRHAEHIHPDPSRADPAESAPAAPVRVFDDPLLTTLAEAVSGRFNPQVDLTDLLGSGEITVFAPVDSAFAALGPATLAALRTDWVALTTILAYHAVPGRLTPDAITGVLGTAEGSDLAVTRTGDRIAVNNATVVGGDAGIGTATVYLIDRVLIPPTVAGA